jgi:hypothetical protein
MKTNKKAILGMLVAIVMSLGTMSGINSKSNDSNLQQISLGSAYMAGESESVFGTVGWGAASAISGRLAVSFGYGALTLGWCPAGWVSAAGAGVLAL